MTRYLELRTGGEGEVMLGNVALPIKVVVERLVGWWDRVYVVDGVEEV